LEERFIVLRTVVDVYLKEADLLVRQLEKRKDDLVAAHAAFGPSSTVANQAQGQLYYTISRLMYELDRLGTASREYIENLEIELTKKGVDMEKEVGRLKKMMDKHHVKLAAAKTRIKERTVDLKDPDGRDEKEFLKLAAKRFSDQTNFIMQLKNMMALYFDYIGFLEPRAEVPEELRLLSPENVAKVKDIYLSLEKEFNFEITRSCPSCKEDITLSPLSPKFICPYCGSDLGI
jgi:hypothetical protein